MEQALNTDEAWILRSLRQEGPLDGYDLIRAVEDRDGPKWGVQHFYPLLKTVREKGYVERVPRAGRPDALYRVTRSGLKAIRQFDGEDETSLAMTIISWFTRLLPVTKPENSTSTT